MNADTEDGGRQARRFADLGDDCGWNLDASLDAEQVEAAAAMSPGARHLGDLHRS